MGQGPAKLIVPPSELTALQAATRCLTMAKEAMLKVTGEETAVYKRCLPRVEKCKIEIGDIISEIVGT